MNSLDQKIIKQLIQGLNNGTLDLANVPDLQKMIKNAAAQQVAYTINTKDLHAEQAQALKQETAWLHEQAQARLAEINPDHLKHDIVATLDDREQRLNQQQANLEDLIKQAEETQRSKFWHNLMPTLAAFAVCLLLVTVIFFVLQKLIYQGIWNGWGLHKLYDTVLAIQPQHPYGAIFLGIVGLVLIAIAIYTSFWLLVQSVRRLADFEPSKLLFWKKPKKPRW
ncbi:MAG: hypothetical protein L0I27_03475 [Lactococcus raffinolactis]|nr:hypothetical protein [Acinetobacter sp.]MDN6044291.1 hypothetical protein [Lactococcus raffinolactis]MDN6053810.1 hypothetical protein [Lactococcus lactis]MDN6119238.1 hypothetical protein [Lactococcus sp.]MDN5677268.1 hypothetical protein [Acinetobacter sp.]